MAKAVWNGVVIAESDVYEIVENNVYFPPSALRMAHFQASDTHTTCPWKGVASYYDVVVGGSVNRDAAWFYPETRPKAKHIEGYVAFWRGVEVSR